MTGKIGKSHPHFQDKHRVSPHFLAGGGIPLSVSVFTMLPSEKGTCTDSQALIVTFTCYWRIVRVVSRRRLDQPGKNKALTRS